LGDVELVTEYYPLID